MILQGFFRVSSQICMVSVGIQLKIWSLASVSICVTNPFKKFMFFFIYVIHFDESPLKCLHHHLSHITMVIILLIIS